MPCLLLCASTLTFNYLHCRERPKFFVYMTNWALVLAIANYALALLSMAAEHRARMRSGEDTMRTELNFVEKLSWTLNTCNTIKYTEIIICARAPFARLNF